MTRTLAVLLLLGGSRAAAQSLDQRVARAPDGEVRFSYAARPGVYGDGRDDPRALALFEELLTRR